MNNIDIEKIKRELSFHTLHKPCRNCGECERILDMALKEARDASSDKEAVKCEKCGL